MGHPAEEGNTSGNGLLVDAPPHPPEHYGMLGVAGQETGHGQMQMGQTVPVYPFLDSCHCLLKPPLPGQVGMRLTAATSSSALKYMLETGIGHKQLKDLGSYCLLNWGCISYPLSRFVSLSVPYVPGIQRV